MRHSIFILQHCSQRSKMLFLSSSCMGGQASHNSFTNLIALLTNTQGSFLEFLGFLDYFRKRYSPEELPYHIIAPSLPGYTLSSGPPLTKTWDIEDNGRILNKLMVGLGFGSGYIAQGGDVGSFECRVLATYYEECKGMFSEHRPVMNEYF